VARNGRVGRLPNSAGVRRNPQQHAGTGARSGKRSAAGSAPSGRRPARSVSVMDGEKQPPNREWLGLFVIGGGGGS